MYNWYYLSIDAPGGGVVYRALDLGSLIDFWFGQKLCHWQHPLQFRIPTLNEGGPLYGAWVQTESLLKRAQGDTGQDSEERCSLLLFRYYWLIRQISLDNGVIIE